MVAGPVELRQCHSRNVGLREGGEERRGPEAGMKERGREMEMSQHIHDHVPLLAQRLLFGCFHSTSLQWQGHTQCEPSAHKPM